MQPPPEGPELTQVKYGQDSKDKTSNSEIGFGPKSKPDAHPVLERPEPSFLGAPI